MRRWTPGRWDRGRADFREPCTDEVRRTTLPRTRVYRARGPSRGRSPDRHPPKLGVAAQLLQPETYAPLDRAQRQAEALGHLRLRQAPDVEEREDLALFVREVPEGFAHPLLSVVAPGFGEGLARLVPRGLGFGRLTRPAAARGGPE